MNLKKILIIEDEAIIAEGLKLTLENLGYQVVGICLNRKEFLEFTINHSFDVALVDIMLGKTPDGFEIAKYIKNQLNKPFIFVTSYSDKDTLQKAKFLNPAGYIIKPYQKKDLLAAIEIIPDSNEVEEELNGSDVEKVIDNALFYKDQHLLKKITISNILYVEAFKNYIEIIETNQKHVLRATLYSVLDKLPSYFLRVHKSFIVNIKHLDVLNSAYLKIKEKEIPVSKNYRETIIKLIEII